MLILPLLVLALGMTPEEAPKIDAAIEGATVIDPSGASRDVDDAVILIAHGRIIAVGDHAHVHVPSEARVINARGRYVIPGLMDGYGALRSQAYADAYLYEGVTTVVVPLAPRDAAIDGELEFVQPSSGPALVTSWPISGYAMSGDILHKSPWTDHRANDRRLNMADLEAEVAAAAERGAHLLAIDQDVWPDQMVTVVADAHRRAWPSRRSRHSRPTLRPCVRESTSSRATTGIRWRQRVPANSKVMPMTPAAPERDRQFALFATAKR